MTQNVFRLLDFDKLVGPGARRIEKNTDYDYHMPKQKLELVLAYRELGAAISNKNLFQLGSFRYVK